MVNFEAENEKLIQLISFHGHRWLLYDFQLWQGIDLIGREGGANYDVIDLQAVIIGRRLTVNQDES